MAAAGPVVYTEGKKPVVAPVENLKAMFTSLKKFTRRTVPFGVVEKKSKKCVDEVYLREMNISSAGKAGVALYSLSAVQF
jgi:hypothetical protein